jgi:D-alanyl-D-alanine carboxypeptidase
MVNHKQVGHGGGIPGFTTYIARFPEDDAAVIVLSNNVQSPAQEIAAALFNQTVTLPSPASATGKTNAKTRD